jgi:hypothetical protein
MELVKAYSLTSEDGVNIQVSDTPDRESVILILVKEGVSITASLNKEMFETLFDLKYKMDVHGKTRKEEAA